MLCSVECKENNAVMRIRAVQALEKSGFIVYKTNRNILAMVMQKNSCVACYGNYIEINAYHVAWWTSQDNVFWLCLPPLPQLY